MKKKYQVELCYSLYATVFEVEADDERDAIEKTVLAFNQSKGIEPSLDLSSLSRWRDADMIEEVEDGSENSNNPEGP